MSVASPDRAEQPSRVIDDRASVGAVIAVSITGILFFLGLPVITGALAEDRGLGSEQLGALASIAMGTTFLSSMLVTSIVARFRRRPMVICALLLMVLGHCGFVWGGQRFYLLALSGVASGFGGGVCYSMCLGILAAARNSVRVFSILLFCQVLVTGVELAGLPLVANATGVSGVFAVLAAVSAAALFLTPLIPEGRAHYDDAVLGTLGTARVLSGGLSLAGVVSFYVAIGSLWTFLERMGVSLKLTSAFVGSALSIGNLLSLFSTLIAVAFASRVGAGRALFLSLVILAAALAVMGSALTVPTYLGGTAVFFLSWNLIDIFQATAISGLDRAGRFTALIPAAQSLGNTLGPALAGIVLGSGRSYAWVLFGTSACVATAIGAQLGAQSVLRRFRRADFQPSA
jgi:predicted MFS family arabinose efflux permease